MSKEYGLIIPGKNKMVLQAPGRRAAIFDEDSDSDEPTPAKPTFLKPLEKKQTKIAQDKAIEEDPTVYQYDEIYDDMEKKRNDSKLSRKDLEKKPKYISNLLRAAERRKRDNERRIERQVQKEREAEGDEFKDKESYVTPSYQKKLEEMKALEEKEKREEYLESIGDVRKQGNLDGFYRHLYDQKVNYEDQSIKEENSPSEKTKDVVNEFKVKKRKSSSEDEDKEAENTQVTKKTKTRQYRTREDSNSEEETVVDVKKEHIPSNLDADSDFSIDSSDSEDEEAKKKKQVDKKKEESPQVEIKQEALSNENVNNNENGASSSKEQKNTGECEIKEEATKIEKQPLKKPKIDIWKKRTVGEVFEAARKRYFERLELRNSG